jgi:hypothetical protein
MPICFPSFGRAAARHAETLEANGMPEGSGLIGKDYPGRTDPERPAGPAIPPSRPAEIAARRAPAGPTLVRADPIV